MTTRPTDAAATWATDAAYDAPGKAWDGDPPVLAPGAGLQAEGWEPGQAVNARFLNWLMNNHGAWLDYLSTVVDANDEHTYPTAKTARILRVPLEMGRAVYGSDWRFNYIDPFDSAARCAWDAYTDSGRIVFPLTSILRVGMTITAIGVMTRSAAAGGITLDLRKQEHNTVSATVYASSSVATGAGTPSGGRELLGVGAVSEVVAVGFEYHLIAKAGTDASTNHDQILDVFIVVTDPGPRNRNG